MNNFLTTKFLLNYFVLLLSSHVVGLVLAGDGDDDSSPGWCRDSLNDRQFGSKCYAFYEDSSVRSYEAAALYCRALGKALSGPETTDEQRFFVNAIESVGWSRALIGLRFQLSSWRWVADGSMLRGQGCNEQISVDDSLLQGEGVYSASMSVQGCIDLCTINQGGAAFAAVMSGSMCYCANSYVWNTAASACTLPCSGNLGEMCGSLFNSLAFATDPDAYDNWIAGGPTAGGSCAAIKIDYSTNPWKETSCLLALPFLCKFSGSANVVKLRQAGTVQASSCEDGACYVLYSSPELVWSDADAFCTKLGGRLAKIESSDRQSQLNLMLQTDPGFVTVTQAWIGATNRYWQYVADGSSPNFRGWISVSEPNAPEINQCAALSLLVDGSYGWQTKQCNSLADVSSRFACESAVTNATTPRPPGTRRPRTTRRPSSSGATRDGAKPSEDPSSPDDDEFYFTEIMPGETTWMPLHRTSFSVARTTRRRVTPSTTPATLPELPKSPATSRFNQPPTPTPPTSKQEVTMTPSGSPRRDPSTPTPSGTRRDGTSPSPTSGRQGAGTSAPPTVGAKETTPKGGNKDSTPFPSTPTPGAGSAKVTTGPRGSDGKTTAGLPAPSVTQTPPSNSPGTSGGSATPAVSSGEPVTPKAPTSGSSSGQTDSHTPANSENPGTPTVKSAFGTIMCEATCRNSVTASTNASTQCWARGSTTPPKSTSAVTQAPSAHNEHQTASTASASSHDTTVTTLYGPDYDAIVDCRILVTTTTAAVDSHHNTGGSDSHGSTDNHATDDNHGSPSGQDASAANAQAQRSNSNSNNKANSTVNNLGLTWWAVLLIVVACLAVVGAGLGVAIYLMKKSAANARVGNRDSATPNKNADATSENLTPAAKSPAEPSSATNAKV